MSKTLRTVPTLRNVLFSFREESQNPEDRHGREAAFTLVLCVVVVFKSFILTRGVCLFEPLIACRSPKLWIDR